MTGPARGDGVQSDARELERPANGGHSSTIHVAYLLRMYPQLSETFILGEILELERQGVQLEIFSLMQPTERIRHRDVGRVRRRLTYVPSLGAQPRAVIAAHARLLRVAPGRYCRALCDALRRPFPGDFEDDEVGGTWGALKHFLKAGFIASRLEQKGIRHLHSHFAGAATSVALHVSRLTDVSYSFTAYARDIYLDRVRPDDLRVKMGSARFTVTVSDYNRRHLAGLAPEAEIVRIYNGLDLEAFSPNGRSPERPPLILAVGRLVEKKGFGDLIRACALLRDWGQPFSCRIVGKGPLHGELRDLIIGLRLQGVVELAGPMPREALVHVFPRASVFAAPCLVARDGNRDGLPNVLVEAMAVGVPVVATPVTGIPELVDDGRTGILVPERDPDALARALRQLLENEAKAEALVRPARRRVEHSFDIRRNVGQLRELLAEASAA
jgi:colanic acid/amylovoran biosynthesis glycosyltransferase